MKRTIITLALAAGMLLPATAQQRWTLRECIDHAVENNIEIRQTALGVENAALDLNTAQNSRLPNLSAGVNQSFSFGRTSIDTGGDSPEYMNTQTSGTSLNLSAAMPIFQGFRIANQIRSSKLDLAAAAAGLERAKESLELNVAALYLDVLFKKEIAAVYREQTELVREQVENTTVMVDEGAVARSQLYEIEAQLASAQVNEVRADNDVALALLTLSQALNLSDAGGFDIAVVDAAALAPGTSRLLPDEIYRTALEIKPAVREADYMLQSSVAGVKIARSAALPSLSLSAGAGAGYTYMFGQDFPQQSLADQIRNRHSESVGLGLSIPIFNRHATRNNIRAAELGVMNRTLALEGVRQTLYKEINQAWQRAVAAATSYEASTKALAASQEAFRAMELRYTAGKATAYEYSEASANLASSRSEQTRARYDYLFSSRVLDFYSGLPIEI
ncbi:MAG: TolC family protein [Alistipes sp.]|jgi:outer membrane protein|nr:TolC family protein [Alistipes sp.]